MNNTMLRLFAVCLIAVTFSSLVYPQQDESKKRRALKLSGKAVVIVGKAAMKATFETAKFAGKHIVVPAFKDVAIPIAKAAPPVAARAVKLTAKGIRNGVRVATDRDRDDRDPDTKGSN